MDKSTERKSSKEQGKLSKEADVNIYTFIFFSFKIHENWIVSQCLTFHLLTLWSRVNEFTESVHHKFSAHKSHPIANTLSPETKAPHQALSSCPLTLGARSHPHPAWHSHFSLKPHHHQARPSDNHVLFICKVLVAVRFHCDWVERRWEDSSFKSQAGTWLRLSILLFYFKRSCQDQGNRKSSFEEQSVARTMRAVSSEAKSMMQNCLDYSTTRKTITTSDFFFNHVLCLLQQCTKISRNLFCLVL